MIGSRMDASKLAVAACSIGIMALVACKPAPPPPAQRADYSQTLNKYYEGRPMCLWQETIKFPVEAATPDQIGFSTRNRCRSNFLFYKFIYRIGI